MNGDQTDKKSGIPELILDDVILTKEEKVIPPEGEIYYGEGWQSGPDSYLLSVPGTGTFLARGGKRLSYTMEPGADPGWVNLYLNSHMMVALLHQRGIINFHASSFIYRERGIMITGATGSGKSSLTASFALGGGGFLSDDVTPVLFESSSPVIRPLGRPVKISPDTAEQLSIDHSMMYEAEKGTGKRYLRLERATAENIPLHIVLKLEKGDVDDTEFIIPGGPEKFSLLRSEICSWEILAGMPATEVAYLRQLVDIVSRTEIIRVIRPEVIAISDLRNAIEEYLDRLPL